MDVNFNMNHQLNNLRFGCIIMPKSFKEFLNIKDSMVSKNEDLIVEFNLFEED
jgi:hypothetical protein